VPLFYSVDNLWRKGYLKSLEQYFLCFEQDETYRCSATRLPWLFSFRPVALRPRFSTSLPFRSSVF